MESKDFIPPIPIDWFKNPISTPNPFEEDNMANISPTIYVNISTKLSMIENIIINTSYSLDEVVAYTKMFQEF